MKIGIDVRVLMAKNYSGVSFYTLNLLKALFDIDNKNEYLLFYNTSRTVNLPKLQQKNVKYVGFNYSNKFFNFSLNFFSCPRIDKMLGGVDVLLVPNINFLSWSSQCKTVMVVHDLSYLRFPHFFPWKMRLWHKLLYKNIKKADEVITVSKNTKQDVIDLLEVPEEKIKVIYEGVESKFRILDSNDDKIKQVKEKYNLPEKFILYLGTLEPRKNIESVIEAYQDLKTDYQLVIAGGKGWKSEIIYDLASGDDNIKLIGYVNEDDKVVLYNLAGLFVYPSYYEGFGLPLLEAMACGVPVICGSNSSQGEVVGNAGMLVDAYNVNEIKQGIEIILKDEKLRVNMIELGLERAKEFKWENTAKELFDNLKKLPNMS